MIAAAIISVTAAAGLTAFFWADIKQFLKDTLEEIRKQSIRFLQGCRVCLQKIKRGFVTMVKVIASYYTKQDHMWERISFHEELEESQVPPELLERIEQDEEYDITEELQLQLTEQ